MVGENSLMNGVTSTISPTRFGELPESSSAVPESLVDAEEAEFAFATSLSSVLDESLAPVSSAEGDAGPDAGKDAGVSSEDDERET